MKKKKNINFLIPAKTYDEFKKKMKSKKKKREKKKKKVSKRNIEILDSGKVKFNKDNKISLDPYIQDSINASSCSRIDGLITEEDVVIDSLPENKEIYTDDNLSNIKKVLELSTEVSSNKISTIVYPVIKKDALDIFNFLDDTIVGYLLRTSTLASIYKEKKEKWVELNKDDKSSFTNVLFFKDIFVFLDDKNGDVLKAPYKVNLLIVASPGKKYLETGIEKVETETIVKRIIDDIQESVIRLQAKYLLISPYSLKCFEDEAHLTASYWKEKMEEERMRANVESINFCIDDDDLYIIFKKSKEED